MFVVVVVVMVERFSFRGASFSGPLRRLFRDRFRRLFGISQRGPAERREPKDESEANCQSQIRICKGVVDDDPKSPCLNLQRSGG